jgi:hypothetical protein
VGNTRWRVMIASGSIVLASIPNHKNQGIIPFCSTRIVETDVMSASALKSPNPSISIQSQQCESSDAQRFVLPKLVHPEQEGPSGNFGLSIIGENQQDADVQDRLDSIHKVYPLLYDAADIFYTI